MQELRYENQRLQEKVTEMTKLLSEPRDELDTPNSKFYVGVGSTELRKRGADGNLHGLLSGYQQQKREGYYSKNGRSPGDGPEDKLMS
jgi:hypothetical protein